MRSIRVRKGLGSASKNKTLYEITTVRYIVEKEEKWKNKMQFNVM